MIIHEGMEKSGNSLGFIPENGGNLGIPRKTPLENVEILGYFSRNGKFGIFPFFFFFSRVRMGRKR